MVTVTWLLMECRGNVFSCLFDCHCMCYEQCFRVVHPSGGAEPPKVCIKETDYAVVHCAVWCFVHPHMVACCLHIIYNIQPAMNRTFNRSLGSLVPFVCKTIRRTVFYFRGRKGLKVISTYQPGLKTDPMRLTLCVLCKHLDIGTSWVIRFGVTGSHVSLLYVWTLVCGVRGVFI